MDIAAGDEHRSAQRAPLRRGRLRRLRRRAATVALAVAALGFAAACSALRYSRWSRVYLDVDDRTENARESFEVADGVDQIEVELAMRLDRGTAEWRLVDPRGHVRLVAAPATGESYTLNRTLEPITGEWIVHRDLCGFSGCFDLHLRARSECGLNASITLSRD